MELGVEREKHSCSAPLRGWSVVINGQVVIDGLNEFSSHLKLRHVFCEGVESHVPRVRLTRPDDMQREVTFSGTMF